MSDILLTDGIVKIKNMFDPNVSKLIQKYTDKKAKEQMETVGRKDFLSQRNVLGYHLGRSTPSDIWIYNLIRNAYNTIQYN